MQEKDTTTTEQPATERANIGKAVEIYVKDGKVHLVTALGKDGLLQVLSLATVEAVKEATKKGDS